MKSLKTIAFLMAVLLAAGCADTTSAITETTAPLTEETAARTTVSETASAGETMTERESGTEHGSRSMRAAEGKRVFEAGKSYVESHFSLGEDYNYDHELLNRPEETDDPTLAERLYRALYDFSVFFQYAEPCYLQYLQDPQDVIKTETVAFDWLHKSQTDRDYAYTDYAAYRRIKYGEITTIDDYYSRFFQVATEGFDRSDAHLFKKQFVLSDGNLYLNPEPESVSYQTPSADSRLNRICKVLSPSAGEVLELSFTASFERYDIPYTEDYVITLRYEDDYGWRVDGCSSAQAVGYLIGEILEGGKDHRSPKTDLPEEIKLWLGQIGLM